MKSQTFFDLMVVAKETLPEGLHKKFQVLIDELSEDPENKIIASAPEPEDEHDMANTINDLREAFFELLYKHMIRSLLADLGVVVTRIS